MHDQAGVNKAKTKLGCNDLLVSHIHSQIFIRTHEPKVVFEYYITCISTEEVTLEAQSDKSDMRRSSGSATLYRGILYLNISSPLEALTMEIP